MEEVSATYVHDNLATLQILDCRESREFDGPLPPIPQAIRWPLSRLYKGELPDLPAHNVVVVCRSGHRSLAAARILESYGYQAVSMAGGMKEWHQRGY